MAIYADAMELPCEEWTAAYTPDFNNLRSFMESEGCSIILNAGSGSYCFDEAVFEELGSVALNQAAGEAASRAEDGVNVGTRF